jgi:tetratricopeptide repeat protein
VSLIGDALARAERERRERNGMPETLGDNTPLDAPVGRRTRLPVLGGLAASLVAIPAVALLARGHDPVLTRQPIAVSSPALAIVKPDSTAPVVVLQADVPAPTAVRDERRTEAPPADESHAPAPPRAIVAPPAASRPDTRPARPTSLTRDATRAPAASTRPAPSVVADSLFHRAYAEQTNGNVGEALAFYERTVATRHASAQAYNNYGVLLLARGNQTAAAEMFHEALNRDDQCVEAWVNLGDILHDTGRQVEAMSAYAHANRLDPFRAAVKVRLSRELESIGDTTGAHRYLARAVDASPGDLPAHYALGAYLERVGNFADALREFQTVVDLGSPRDDREFVAQVRRHMDELKRLVP